MDLTPRRLNRATLQRQFLLERTNLDPVAAVEHLVGLQAQDATSPYLSLWARIEGFDAAALDRAFAERALVKASLMRITLHAASARDYGTWYAAMAESLRSSREYDKRFRPAQMTSAEVNALLPQLTSFLSTPRTDADLEAWFKDRVAGDPSVAWWAFRTFAPNFRLPTGGPWAFGKLLYDAPQAGLGRPFDDAVDALLLRYLGSFGPATAKDFARFTLLRSPVVNQALKRLGDGVTRTKGADGQVYLDLPGAVLPPEDTPAPPRLLPMWDNLFLGHVSSARLLPAEYRRTVIQVNGDILPTLLVDGEVVGVWRRVAEGVEATAFRALDPASWAGLEREAANLLAFLETREPRIYTRSHHWWAKGLPSAEVRVLGL